MNILQPNPPTEPDDQTATTCLVCQKLIVDNQWFCRVPEQIGVPDAKTKWTLLCSPGCACRYFSFADPGISQV